MAGGMQDLMTQVGQVQKGQLDVFRGTPAMDERMFKAMAELRERVGMDLPIEERRALLARAEGIKAAVHYADASLSVLIDAHRMVVEAKRAIGEQLRRDEPVLSPSERGKMGGRGNKREKAHEERSEGFMTPHRKRVYRELSHVPLWVLDAVYTDARRKGVVPSEADILRAARPAPDEDEGPYKVDGPGFVVVFPAGARAGWDEGALTDIGLALGEAAAAAARVWTQGNAGPCTRELESGSKQTWQVAKIRVEMQDWVRGA